MAKVIMIRGDDKLTQIADDAKRAGADCVPIGAYELGGLLYRSGLFRQMRLALRSAGFQGRPELELPRALGSLQALERMLTSPVAPDSAWPVWAHLRLGRGGDPLAPGVDLRRAIGDKLDELDSWILWAKDLYREHTGERTDASTPLRPWIGTMARRGAEAEELGNKLTDATPAPAPPGDDWFVWAAQALGLSQAYVEEQKLTTDDLRRMIRERL